MTALPWSIKAYFYGTLTFFGGTSVASKATLVALRVIVIRVDRDEETCSLFFVTYALCLFVNVISSQWNLLCLKIALILSICLCLEIAIVLSFF